MRLGRLELSLNVSDLAAAREFYSKLGFRSIEGDERNGYLIMGDGANTLGLYQGHIPANLLNFRGGDVFAIATALESAGLTLDSPAQIEPDGSSGAWISDPDGNRLYFNTAVGETADSRG